MLLEVPQRQLAEDKAQPESLAVYDISPRCLSFGVGDSTAKGCILYSNSEGKESGICGKLDVTENGRSLQKQIGRSRFAPYIIILVRCFSKIVCISSRLLVRLFFQCSLFLFLFNNQIGMRLFSCILNLKSRAGSKKYLCMAWEPLFACSEALLSCLSSGRIVLSQQSNVHKHFFTHQKHLQLQLLWLH